jgi:hypothetical protein
MSTVLTKTLDDAVTEIRAIVNDSNTNFQRFSNQLVVQKINTALREVYRYRPDAFIGNFTQGVFGNNSPLVTYSITDLGLTPATPWPIDDRLFFTCVVFYVAGILDLSDDEFSDDNRAMTLLAAFRTELVGPGG